MAQQQQQDVMSSMEQRMSSVRAEREQQDKRKMFDKKMIELQQKTADMVQEYGYEDFRSQMMLTFLDVALQMKDMMKTMEGFNVALGCIYEAISFSDSALDYGLAQAESSMDHKYGFFQRWKIRRKLKKAQRNQVGRMKSMMDSMSSQLEMAHMMTDSMRDVFGGMQKRMAKMNKKYNGKSSKYGPDVTMPTANGTARKLIEDELAARGAKVDDSGANTGAPTSGPDDLSDIT